MLLSVEPFDDGVEGTLLDLWFVGGGHKTVRPPCPPHYFSAVEQGDAELVRRRLLSKPSVEQMLYKVTFPTLASLDRFRLFGALESHKRFVDVLASDFGFDQPSGEPTVLSWDTESFTFSKIAPDWHRDTIRSISVWSQEEHIAEKWKELIGDAVLMVGSDNEFGICWSVDDAHDEEWVIKQFIKFVQSFNPDVLCGYNDGDYDLRLLLTRCNVLRIACRLGRDGSIPYVLTRQYERRGKEREVNLVRIRGRVHLDVLAEVFYDQTLYDLKGRGQVEVAGHFGFAPIEDVNHASIPEERLAEVNLDDARCCYGLAKFYSQNIYALCDYLKVPLNLMVERSPSHIPNWFYGQEYSRLGIVSDGYNNERFPQIFARGGKPYQGAFVKCYKTGLFWNVEHIDYAGFYPSIMLEYNLSPETVSLVETKPYTGLYIYTKHKGYDIIEVPDKPKVGEPLQFVCRVDTSKDSVTRTRLKWIADERARLKAEYNETKDERLQSRQYALKVIQNTLYGYNGTPYALYGNVLVAILITALARFHIQELIGKLKKEGKQIIEVDTDGLYCVD